MSEGQNQQGRGEPGGGGQEGAAGLDPAASLEARAALSAGHGRAERAFLLAVQTAEQLAGASTRHRAVVEGIAERQRSAGARVGEAKAALSRLSEAHARLGVLGLNAGLEGARLEGAAGRALLMLADELRALVARASGTSSDVGSAIDELAAEVSLLEGQASEARASASSLSEASSHLLSAAHQAHGELGQLGEQIALATGLDPETAAEIERAEAHARELDASLGRLVARTGPEAQALAQALAPLLGRLGQLAGRAPRER